MPQYLGPDGTEYDSIQEFLAATHEAPTEAPDHISDLFEAVQAIPETYFTDADRARIRSRFFAAANAEADRTVSGIDVSSTGGAAATFLAGNARQQAAVGAESGASEFELSARTADQSLRTQKIGLLAGAAELEENARSRRVYERLAQAQQVLAERRQGFDERRYRDVRRDRAAANDPYRPGGRYNPVGGAPSGDSIGFSGGGGGGGGGGFAEQAPAPAPSGEGGGGNYSNFEGTIGAPPASNVFDDEFANARSF